MTRCSKSPPGSATPPAPAPRSSFPAQDNPNPPSCVCGGSALEPARGSGGKISAARRGCWMGGGVGRALPALSQLWGCCVPVSGGSGNVPAGVGDTRAWPWGHAALCPRCARPAPRWLRARAAGRTAPWSSCCCCSVIHKEAGMTTGSTKEGWRLGEKTPKSTYLNCGLELDVFAEQRAGPTAASGDRPLRAGLPACAGNVFPLLSQDTARRPGLTPLARSALAFLRAAGMSLCF